MQTKKIINDGERAVDEMLDGILAAHPRHLARVEAARARSSPAIGPRPGKVGLVIGGGSGHEPTFLGFVGKGLADAAAIGNVFASPPPDPIVECAKAVSGGAGVLFMYGNYAGDVMNFDMAAEMAAMDDIEVRTVLTTDDVASAPRDRRQKRRGVAGNFFIFKAAGAACDRMLSFDECERIARKANDHTFTMGVALAPCSLPQTRRPNFEIGADEMEIGMGIHGEPGVARGQLQPADEITDEMLDRILAEMAPSRGDRVAVLVNSLGSTPLMELYIMNRRVAAAARRHRRRDARDLGRQLLHLARNGRRLGHAACISTASCRRCSTIPATAPCSAPAENAMTHRREHGCRQHVRRDRGRDRGRTRTGSAARRRHRRRRPRHRHGARLRRGARRVGALDLAAAEPTAVFNTAAKSFLNAVGASSGPLYATAFMRAAAAVKGKATLDDADVVALFQAMAQGIRIAARPSSAKRR